MHDIHKQLQTDKILSVKSSFSKRQFYTRRYNLPTSTGMLLSIPLSRLLYSLVLRIYLSSCIGCKPRHSLRMNHKNSPFNCMIYANFQVVLLHSHEHEGNHVT